MFTKTLWVSGTLLVLVMVTSTLAASAAPGDFLYTYKTQVNDRITSWFAVEYVKDVDHQIDMIEDRLAEIDEQVASGKLTPEKAVELKNNLLAQITAAENTIANSSNKQLTPAQIKQLKDGLDRMQNALQRYSKSLAALDTAAANAPEKKKKRGGGKRTHDAVVDIIDALEEEIVEAIDEIDETSSDDESTETTDESGDTTDETTDDSETTPSDESDTTAEENTETATEEDDSTTESENTEEEADAEVTVETETTAETTEETQTTN